MRFSSVLIACAAVVLSAEPVRPQTTKPRPEAETGRFYFPNRGKSGIVQVKPGQELLHQPVVWSRAAKIDRSVTLQTSAGPAIIAAGSVLPAVTVIGLPGQSGSVIAYCTSLPFMKARSPQFGMLALLSTKGVDSLRDGRKCLLDHDADGAADLAFLIDKGTAEDRQPRPLAPVAWTIASDVPVGEGDFVSIRAGKAARPSFDIEIYRAGAKVDFQSIDGENGMEPRYRVLEKTNGLPSAQTIFGATFTVTAFDTTSRTTTIELPSDLTSRKVAVPSEVLFVYRYF